MKPREKTSKEAVDMCVECSEMSNNKQIRRMTEIKLCQMNTTRGQGSNYTYG